MRKTCIKSNKMPSSTKNDMHGFKNTLSFDFDTPSRVVHHLISTCREDFSVVHLHVVASMA